MPRASDCSSPGGHRAELPEAMQRLGGASGFLAPHQVEAGRQLAQLFESAMIRQRVTMSYDPTRIGGRAAGSGQTGVSDMASAARKRLAQDAVRLPRDCWDLLVEVCCYDKGLQQIETERRWPRRSAKLVLRIALEQLARMRGLDETGKGGHQGDVRAWLPERPAMFADSAD
ncbi:MAG: hypothetical protein KIT02_00010 [Devosia sp.]|uniref:DUF6456 domain-containing protein n=1 Tax=Devosia sp. TaxID=1871048 RepID=UPI0024CA9291|nr:DUF6456 domain-containing protein [Devosia sp.]UYN99672.1 MAG: hypothetical protein KIT02_00010 [Devosia sp.]